MYRPKHTVSKRRAGRILRGIYACFFAALVIAFLTMPSGNVKAAGGGKGYPVDAWYLTDINTLEHHTLEFNGNVGGDVVSYYTRLSCKIGQKRINGVTKV